MRLILFAALLMTACGSKIEREMTKLQPPVVVTKTVEVYRALPDWATQQVPNKPPADGTVGGLKDANNARAHTLDWVNCRSRLLAKWDKGEPVSIKDCGK